MNTEFDFLDLYIFEIANNHQGSVDHGRRIVGEIGRIARTNGIRAAAKLQMRQLDTFVHPAHRQSATNKHIPRFLSTRLSTEDYAALLVEIRRQGLVSMCTPFDEASVDAICDLGFEVMKIGSPSATDWPLIEHVAASGKPVIFSTGGLALKQIDDLVSYFDHRRVHFAVMHCVSIYPTPTDKLQLNQIDVLRDRYPGKVIGFSTHEAPDQLTPVQVAIAKGARMLERHVGLPTDQVKLNAYSSEPSEADRWVQASLAARRACGDVVRTPTPEELSSLRELKRGAYAKRAIEKGEELSRDDVYFAMPLQDGQLAADDWQRGVVAGADVAENAPLMTSCLQTPAEPETQILYTAIHTIKAMLNEARVALNTEFEAEFSHHYGLAKFPEFGATIVQCVNRGYCKKLVIQTPGQHHPSHFHKRKEETFQVLSGVLEMNLEGRRRTLYPGDIQLIQQGAWHEFWTDTGAIVEEISSTHFNDDSFYEDKVINRMDRSARKTVVNNWGRYQI